MTQRAWTSDKADDLLTNKQIAGYIAVILAILYFGMYIGFRGYAKSGFHDLLEEHGVKANITDVYFSPIAPLESAPNVTLVLPTDNGPVLVKGEMVGNFLVAHRVYFRLPASALWGQ